MTRKTSRIALLLLVAVVALLALVKAVPYFINKDQIRLAIEKGLRESTGVHFAIKELTLETTLFHGIQAHLNTTTITDANHNALGDVKNISVQLRYLPLFLKRTPEIAKIHINDVRIPIGKHNLFEELEFNFKEPEDKGFIKPAKMRDTEILLTNYFIDDQVVDETIHDLLPKAKRFTLKGDEISIRHLESDQPISVLGKGEMVFPTDKDEMKNPIHLGRYNVLTEIPQSVTEEGHKFSARDIARMNLGMQEEDFGFEIRYKHEQDSDKGTGTIDSRDMNLTELQAVALQLGDTLGLPLPDSLSQVYLAGQASMDQDFDLRFTGPNTMKLSMRGSARLKNVAAAHPDVWPHPALNSLTGRVDFLDNVIRTQRLSMRLGELPLLLSGAYNLNTGEMNAYLVGNDLRISSLKRTLGTMGVPVEALAGRDLNGILDITAHATGTANHPRYSGLLNLDNGTFRDDSQGLLISNADARIRFAGAGAKNPRLRYDGVVVVNQGSLNNKQYNASVGSINGKINVNGLIAPGQATPIPAYTGFLNVAQGQYRDPKTGLLVHGVQGLLRLGEKAINLEGFRGLVGSALFVANGSISKDFDSYNVRVVSNDINLQRFKTEVLAKLPQAQGLADQLQAYSGLADVNVNISTGMRMNGRVDVSSLALKTGMDGYPIRVPALSLVFNNREVSVPKTTIYYGPVAMHLNGYFRQPGTYQFDVASDDIPTGMLRDHSELITMFSGQELPEIWNTAGSFGINGKLSNKSTNVTLDFKNVGLSWKGGDFPLYDVNGRLFFKQNNGGKPIISTRDVTFNYGNSPVALDAENGEKLQFTSDGTLSALVVNHFLVSPQSNATPYREIPFHAAANGVLAALPAEGGESKNDVVAELSLDLNPNFKYKYATPGQASDQGPAATAADGNLVVAPPADLPAPSDTAAELPARPDMVSENDRLSNRGNDEEESGKNGNGLNPVGTVKETVKDTVGFVKQTVQSGIDTLIHREAIEEKEAIVQEPAGTTATGERIEIETKNPAAPQAPELAVPPPQADGPVSAQALAVGGDDNAYLTGRVHLLGADLMLEQAAMHLFEGGTLLAEGGVREAFDAANRTFQLRLYTAPEVSLDKLSHSTNENDFFRDAKGTFGGDLTLTGAGTGMNSLNGWFATNQVAIPFLTLQNVTGRMDFSGQSAAANIATFQIPGVNTGLVATTEDIFELPVTLENVQIQGPLLSIQSLVDFNENIVSPILVDQLVHNFSRPWQQGDPRLPIQFRNAKLHFDEVIHQNIIMTNMNSDFSLYANNFMELTNTSLEAAGGRATGYLSMNPHQNNFTTLELNANNVSANALTRALLNQTNQIFGQLDGIVRFTTSGADGDEMLANANGTVSMKVRDGRLPAISKVETLLTAANVLRGGILGLNLNNLFRTLQFYDTNYFAELSGDLLVANRVLYTDNLVSDGINLDLFIRGSLRMDTGSANLIVNGVMNQDVQGRLGPIGRFSIGSLVRFIPGIGSFGKDEPGLLGHIPGVGYVPGLGGPAGSTNRFQVRLAGPLDGPSAIQGFQWVRGTDAEAQVQQAPQGGSNLNLSGKPVQ